VSHHFWHVEGIYEIIAANIQEMETNFKQDVPPIRIAGNIQHDFGGPAVGWVEDVRATPAGLEVRVRWTEFGQQQIDQELFAYVSPEWWDLGRPYVVASTGEKIPWVFDGFGLTNTPFFAEELPGLVAERSPEGMLVCAPDQAPEANQGDPDMRPDQQPNQGQAPDNPAPGPQPDVTAVTAENTRLKAENDRLTAASAKAAREKLTADLTARFAGVKLPGKRALAPAHAAALANTAIDIPDDRREAHVAATIAALEHGQVEEGERGGTSPTHVTGEGISPALVATARRLGLDPAFAYAAANRGPGGTLNVPFARTAVERIGPLSASVEIPSLSYQETMILIEGFFVAGYEATPALTSQFANRVVSSQRTIDYRALGAAPRMQEWFDEIEPKVFNTLTPFPVTVRDWEASVTIPLSELQADKLGQYAMRVQQMGAFAKQHPDELLAALIVAAETTLCYDGQDLCDTDHSEGSSGTQSNFLTTGYDDDDLADINLSLGAAIAAFNGFKDDRGQYLRIGSRPDAVFDVLVRPAVLHLFRTLATADVISGTSNGWKGRIRPMALPELTVASDFYVAYVEGPVKPFIVQFQNEPSALKTLGPDSEYATLHGRAFFSTQGNYTVAPGDWRYIIKLQKA
jgi:hypothetical protein